MITRKEVGTFDYNGRIIGNNHQFEKPVLVIEKFSVTFSNRYYTTHFSSQKVKRRDKNKNHGIHHKMFEHFGARI